MKFSELVIFGQQLSEELDSSDGVHRRRHLVVRGDLVTPLGDLIEHAAKQFTEGSFCGLTISMDDVEMLTLEDRQAYMSNVQLASQRESWNEVAFNRLVRIAEFLEASSSNIHRLPITAGREQCFENLRQIEHNLR